ncbi:transketolase, partial [Intrasporangium sp.]|uniref:transketolase n=1 Tax=Intrasporangium sp. TaxID=1925024 RepID=UPI00293B3BE1
MTAEPAVRPVGELDSLAVDTIRFLAADMVEAANSGHPGMPMGAAPMAWTLFSRHLRHDPSDPAWPDRDRFVLSAGHGSALLYAMLHLFGYDLPMSELRRFRQLGSATPGHPEFGHTPGVETTTGPLGQGLGMAVGLALAERMQAARYPEITSHRTYALVGDGCLMEGISHEVASLAGHLGLGRLTVLWDDNEITIDGAVDQSSSDDQLARFESLGWHVQAVADGTDVDAIDAAMTRAEADPRPSFIAVRTVIGHGAPGVEGTPKAHGSPLGPDVLAATKSAAGWAAPAFHVPEEVAARCARLAAEGRRAHEAWRGDLEAFERAEPGRAALWRRAQSREIPANLDELLASIPTGGAQATRQTSQAVLTTLAHGIPELVGGSADLAGSTGTVTGQQAVHRDDYSGSVVHFGIREFGMAAVLNGLSLHGGWRVYGSTFLVFSDYLRPALRLSALMGQPVVYILTHDSLAVGEDGPTHQPVEHVESLRLIPNVRVIRPADDGETVAAWRAALERVDGPTVLVLSRQKVPSFTGAGERILGVGPRVIHGQDGSDVDLLASGSEVGLAVEAARLLDGWGTDTRVVSVPWREGLAEPAGAPGLGGARLTVSLEAGVTSGWAGLVGAGHAIGVDGFGASGPGEAVMRHAGLDPTAVAGRVTALLGRATPTTPPTTPPSTTTTTTTTTTPRTTPRVDGADA